MATATAKKDKTRKAAAPPPRAAAPAAGSTAPADAFETDRYAADEALARELNLDAGRLRLLARREQLQRGGDQRVGQTVRELVRRLLLDLGNRLDVRPLSEPLPVNAAGAHDGGDVSPAQADRARVHEFEQQRRREQVLRETARGETTAQRSGGAPTADEAERARTARAAAEDFESQRRALQTRREIERRGEPVQQHAAVIPGPVARKDE